jgi:hypothetical protein
VTTLFGNAQGPLEVEESSTTSTALKVEAQNERMREAAAPLANTHGGTRIDRRRHRLPELEDGSDLNLVDSKVVIAQAYKAMRHSALTGRNRVVHALNSAIKPVVPWEDIPTVTMIDSAGEMSLVSLDVN